MLAPSNRCSIENYMTSSSRLSHRVPKTIAPSLRYDLTSSCGQNFPETFRFSVPAGTISPRVVFPYTMFISYICILTTGGIFNMVINVMIAILFPLFSLPPRLFSYGHMIQKRLPFLCNKKHPEIGYSFHKTNLDFWVSKNAHVL